MSENKEEKSNVTISLYVDTDFIERVNKAKGWTSRSAFIIGVVEQYLEEKGFGQSKSSKSTDTNQVQG